MKIRNVSGEARMIAATGQHADPDEVIDVARELGESLCEQATNWEAVASEPKTKRAPADVGKEGDD